MSFHSFLSGRLGIRDKLRALVRVVSSSTGRSDYRRWSSPQGLERWWDERTILLAGLIPAGSRVIEFGAGRRQLENHLPPDCSYVPSDLTDRGPGTIVCDLNYGPLPDLRHIAATVAVFSGVLEYVKDVPALVTWLLASGIETFVLSFDGFRPASGYLGILREKRRRLSFGYMNDLTDDALRSIFMTAGFVCCDESRWTTQRLYRFAMGTRTRPQPK
jgi:hypothetical protein